METQEYPGYCLGNFDSEVRECKKCLIKMECEKETGNGISTADGNGK